MLERSDNRDLMKLVLNIVFAAVRRLSVSEMKVAVAIQRETHSFQELLRDEEEDEDHGTRIRQTCSLFINIGDNEEIRFLHQTAKEFIQSNGDLLFISDGTSRSSLPITLRANMVLVQRCVWYLSIRDLVEVQADFKAKDFGPWTVPQLYLENHPFFRYAAQNWPLHFMSGHLLGEEEDFKSYIEICNPHSPLFVVWSTFSGLNLLSDITMLSISAYLGHEALVEYILEQFRYIDSAYPSVRAALREASPNENEGSTKRIESHTIINSQDSYGWTALIYAASKGYEGIVRILVERGASIDVQESNGRTALIYAASDGYEGIVRFLVERGDSINIKTSDGWTALTHAASRGQEDILRILVKEVLLLT